MVGRLRKGIGQTAWCITYWGHAKAIYNFYKASASNVWKSGDSSPKWTCLASLLSSMKPLHHAWCNMHGGNTWLLEEDMGTILNYWKNASSGFPYHLTEKPEPTFWPTQYHSLLPTMGCSALTDIITIYLCIKISQNWGETIGGKCP